MKRSFLAFLIPASLFLSAGACSKHENTENVPVVVIEEFDKEHEEADDVYWEPKGKNFEAKFEDDGVEAVAIYSPKGKPLRVEHVVEKEDVPVVVITRLEKKYPEMEIQQIVYVERPKRKPIYLVRIKEPERVSDIELTVAGIIIRRVIVEDFSIKVKTVHLDHDDHDDHDDCGKHKHKHKHKHGHGHGHCKHDGHDDHHDDHEVGLINIKIK